MQHRKCKIKFPNRRDYRTSISRQRQRRSNNEKKNGRNLLKSLEREFSFYCFAVKTEDACWVCVWHRQRQIRIDETTCIQYSHLKKMNQCCWLQWVISLVYLYEISVFISSVEKFFHTRYVRLKSINLLVVSSAPRKSFFFYLATVYLYDFSRRNRRSNIASKDINQNKKKRHNVTVK